MGLKRISQWMVLALTPLIFFMGCGDLEPEMSDTRTVILKMDLRQNYSLRSSLAHESEPDNEPDNYKTHLIMVLPYSEILYSEYQNYDSIDPIYSHLELMDTESKQVTLEILLYYDNTDRNWKSKQMKIFAFLFKEIYTESELFSELKVVEYYGESQIFTIYETTADLSLAVTLIEASGTDNETDTTAPQLTKVMPVSSPTDYTRIHL